MILDKMAVYDMVIDNRSAGEIFLDEMSVHQMCVEEKALEMIYCQSCRNFFIYLSA